MFNRTFLSRGSIDMKDSKISWFVFMYTVSKKIHHFNKLKNVMIIYSFNNCRWTSAWFSHIKTRNKFSAKTMMRFVIFQGKEFPETVFSAKDNWNIVRFGRQFKINRQTSTYFQNISDKWMFPETACRQEDSRNIIIFRR